MTGTELAASGGGFLGADVEKLDGLAQDFQVAAEIVDGVKTACEVIVAAASIFGPFGAAFVAYLKTTVIPWLTKISEALKIMSKVLAGHSQAQKDTSSSATSTANVTVNLPTYQSPGNLPTGNTNNYPTLPSSVPTSGATPTGSTPATTAGATVTTPPSLGGTTDGATDGASTTTDGAAPTTGGDIAGAVTPVVQTITALTGLVKAVDHLIHPNSGTDGGDVPTDPGTTPTDPGTTPTDPGTTPTDPGTTPTDPGTTPSDPGTTPVGNTGGLDLSHFTPLHPGDTVGVLSIPVDIAPDGTVTPLVHLPGDSPALPTGGGVPDISSLPPQMAPAVHDAALPPENTMSDPALHAGGGGGGGVPSGGGGGGVPAVTPANTMPAIHTPDATPAVTTAVTTPAGHAAAHQPAPLAAPGSDHTGVYTGVGTATGLGAGAAALARAVLHEAKQRVEAGAGGALPADGDSDGAVRVRVLDGELA